MASAGVEVKKGNEIPTGMGPLWVRVFWLLDSKVSWILLFTSGLCCAVSMFLITADVVGRYFFNSPIPGTLEVTEFMLCMIVFGGLTYLEIRGEHVRILLIYSRLSAKAQFALSIFAKGLGFLFFGLMTWQTFRSALHSFIIQEATWGEVSVPLWIGKTFIFLGCLMVTLHLLGSFGLDLFRRERRETRGEEKKGVG